MRPLAFCLTLLLCGLSRGQDESNLRGIESFDVIAVTGTETLDMALKLAVEQRLRLAGVPVKRGGVLVKVAFQSYEHRIIPGVSPAVSFSVDVHVFEWSVIDRGGRKERLPALTWGVSGLRACDKADLRRLSKESAEELADGLASAWLADN
jgi:hypothetical protein